MSLGNNGDFQGARVAFTDKIMLGDHYAVGRECIEYVEGMF